MLNYCKKCVTPTSRPDLKLNKDGICSACITAEQKKQEIDWIKREDQLINIFSTHRHKANYNCIIPVSGGKDSIYQTYMVKNKYDMNPLCISFRPLSRTKRGEENLQALRNLGVDHIDFSPNPIGVNKLTLRAFEEFGDCSLLDHLAIYSIIPNLSLRLDIPLVIWGENPYMEYGGDVDYQNFSTLNRKFFRDHNILKGRSLQDWVSKELSLQELQSMKYPSEDSLDAIGYEPIFLGFFIPWDAKINCEIAVKNGFKPREYGPIMGLYDYADLDCMNIVIHHYFKWIKFGFNRVTDHASNEIRKGRLSRKEAIELVKKFDGTKPPVQYIEKFCKQVNITTEYFWEIVERFRNTDIWKKDENNEWYLKGWIGGDKIPDRFPHTVLDEQEYIL